MGRATPAARQDRAPARILIADDREVGRALLRRLLTRRRYVVSEAVDGAETLDAVARAQPDLVLLDLRLPDIDGSEVLRQLRAEYSAAELPIVMISAEHDGEVAAACLSLGADDFLMKPVQPAVLYARVATCLRTRFARAQIGVARKHAAQRAHL